MGEGCVEGVVQAWLPGLVAVLRVNTPRRGSLTFFTAPSPPQLPFSLKSVTKPPELLHMNLFPVAFG